MTNDEYQVQIKTQLSKLTSLLEESKTTAIKVIGENFLKVDLCFWALLDRCIRLSEGFAMLIEHRNLTCAGAMLRMQLDNCLRLYAIFIAADEEEVSDCIINGSNIDKLKDKQGKKMRDCYLKEQLAAYDCKFATVYDNASGYIHFSSKSFYQIVNLSGENNMSLQCGGELSEKYNETLIECLNAYIHYLKLFYRLMEVAVGAKERFDTEFEAAQNGELA